MNASEELDALIGKEKRKNKKPTFTMTIGLTAEDMKLLDEWAEDFKVRYEELAVRMIQRQLQELERELD